LKVDLCVCHGQITKSSNNQILNNSKSRISIINFSLINKVYIMKKIILQKRFLTLLGAILLGNLSLWAQPFNVDLTLKFNTATSEYEVYARSAVTESFSMGGGSQVSIVLPASTADAALAVTDAAGGPWTDNSIVLAPAAQPISDFHGISTNGTQAVMSLVAGVEKMLFKFTLAGGCNAGVRLYRNAAEGAAPRDPDSNGAGMQGGDFENYLTKVNPIAQRYGVNYSNTGIACGGTSGGTTVQLAAKVFLQGAYDVVSGLMRDDLRAENKLPTAQPYSTMSRFAHHIGTEVRGANAFTATGNNAIVDWVFVELRNAADATEIMATRAALVQRDGDIVDLDGLSALTITAVPGSYFVAVNHRNHLGTMTLAPLTLSSTPLVVDFTLATTATHGTHAQKVVGTKRALWGGNSNNDTKVIFVGPNNDSDRLKDDVLFAPGNTGSDFAYIEMGYKQGDHNLDGEAIYQGIVNDIDPLVFFNVIQHPANTTLNHIFVIYQQIP
jgi:hypothetical protein